jgi:hypothetical protein
MSSSRVRMGMPDRSRALEGAAPMPVTWRTAALEILDRPWDPNKSTARPRHPCQHVKAMRRRLIDVCAECGAELE